MQSELAGRSGRAVVVLAPWRRLQRCVARGADVVLVVQEGRLVVGLGAAGAPEQAVDAGGTAECPRGVPFTVAAADRPVRLLVLSTPAGVEAVLVAMVEGVERARLVGLAADSGVDLLLDPLP